MPNAHTPMQIAAGDPHQIYEIVNSAYKQSSGTDTLTATDTSSLVAMGQELEQMSRMDLWLNSLSRMIGLTIDDYRVYTGQFSSMKRTQMEWGAFVRKYHVEMPEAVTDDTLIGDKDGQSIDHYIIANPKVKQKIFHINAPYSFFITIQRKWIKEAFRNEAEMGTFINSVFGAVHNKIEVTHENLGRLALGNYISKCTDYTTYKLVTMYNNFSGDSITPAEALKHERFLAYAMAQIGQVSDAMQTMSILFNEEKKDRHTPKSMQHLAMLSGFKSAINTIAQRNVRNPGYGVIEPDIIVPYWQAQAKPDGTFLENSGVNTTAEVEKVVAVLYDHEAIGTFREEEDVLTTPVNARGMYYNTFWHENQMYFNDLGENFVLFTLA